MNQKIKITNEDTAWEPFIRGYLMSAELNLKEIKRIIGNRQIVKPTNEGILSDENELLWVDYRFVFSNLWLPTIFSVRHSCELILKSLATYIYGEFPKEHNIDNLIENIREEERENNFFEGYFDKLTSICSKYFSYKFKSETVDLNNFQDTQNMLFRYPGNKFNGQTFNVLNLFELFDSVDESFIDLVLNDIHELYNLHRKLKVTIGYRETFGNERMNENEINSTKIAWQKILEKTNQKLTDF